MANTKTYWDTLASVTEVVDSNIIVVQTDASSDLNTMKQTTVQAIRQPLYNQASSNAAAISSEIARAGASEASIAAALAAESSRAANAESSLASALTSTIGNLTAAQVGGTNKYVKSISESSGVINAVEGTFDTDISGATGHNGGPSSLAVKNYVDGKVGSLSGSVGGSGKLVQSITDNAGNISGTTVNIDSSLSSASSGIPSSAAVKSAIDGFTGSVGGSGVLIQSITESSGKISGTTIALTGTVADNSSAVPTAKAVYNYLNDQIVVAVNAESSRAMEKEEELEANISSIDWNIKSEVRRATASEASLSNKATRWEAYAYFTQAQDPGLIIDIYKDGEYFTPESDKNIELNIKQHLRNGEEKSSPLIISDVWYQGLNIHIQNFKSQLDPKCIGASITLYDLDDETTLFRSIPLFFIREAAQINASEAGFATGKQVYEAASKAYSSAVEHADTRINNLKFTGVGESGQFVKHVKQSLGKISAEAEYFSSDALASYTDASHASYSNVVTTAPNVKVVADQIKRLDERITHSNESVSSLNLDTTGATGAYIKFVGQTEGQLSASAEYFSSAAIYNTTAGTYSTDTTTAPNVKVVADEASRLDTKISTEATKTYNSAASYADSVGAIKYNSAASYADAVGVIKYNSAASYADAAAAIKYNSAASYADAIGSTKVDKNGTDRLMTEAEGTKLSGIATGAEVNKIETIKVNGTTQGITDKTVDISIPSAKVEDVQVKTSSSYATVLDGTTAKIDLSGYALKTDISAVFNFKGEETGDRIKNATTTGASSTLKVEKGDVYTATTDSTDNPVTIHQGYEYYANVSGTTVTWIELGKYLDLSGYATTSALSNEIARATASEASLSTAITNEVTRATNAENGLSTAITNEVARATASEASIAASLDTKISNEITRATASEASVATKVANEITRATASEASIASAIPATYVKSVSASGSTLTLTDQSGNQTTFTDTVYSGTGPIGINTGVISFDNSVTNFITGITGADVTGALNYTPANEASLANYLPLSSMADSAAYANEAGEADTASELSNANAYITDNGNASFASSIQIHYSDLSEDFGVDIYFNNQTADSLNPEIYLTGHNDDADPLISETIIRDGYLHLKNYIDTAEETSLTLQDGRGTFEVVDTNILETNFTRFRYNSSNYWTASVNASGVLTFTHN